MEILLVILFVTTMVVVKLLKDRLPDRIKKLVSLIVAVLFMVWVWAYMDGQFHWKIIVSVVVAASMLMLLFKGRR